MKLDSPVTELSRIGKILANRLKKLEIETIKDLIFYFPWRYDDFSEVIPLGQVEGGMSGSFRGKIELIAGKRSPRKKMHITEALVADDTGSIKVVWFNQPFLTKILKQGQEVTLSGKAEQDYYGLVLQSPSYELSSSGDTTHTARIIPIYSLTSSLTQKQLRTLIKSSLSFIDEVDEWLPDSVKQDLQLMDIAEALHEVHFPSNQEKLNKAQKRLKFEELFLVQLQAQWLKQDNQKSKSPAIEFREKETKQFVGDLPFDLTDDQKKAAWQILQDLAKDHPMNRLLEGDVGSGKTIVSAIALYNAALNNVQAVYMAPTEILAKQQFETLSKLLSGYVVGLLSRSERLISNNGKVNSVSKAKFLKELEAGKIQVSIGTHALIQKDINFNNLGFVVVDEQHRFGVEQRAALVARRPTRTSGTSINADQHADKKNLLYEDLSYKIRGALFAVKKELGLGQKEPVYQKALEQEFTEQGIAFEREKKVDVIYKKKKVGVYQPDFVVDEKIILELKVIPFIGKKEEKQLWNYLRGSEYRLGFLVNFGANDDVQLKRVVYDTVRQRQSASSQPSSAEVRPHLLSMTATPIPRSLALALYGDLDLSIIKQMPKGRKPIITSIINDKNRQSTYDFIKEEINSGRQVFVICPLIDPSDKLGVKSVIEEYEKLNNDVFPDLNIALLHGRMKAAEKEEIMNNFLANNTNILVSTSVIEVGIDVPNSTIMMIEGAERFGLAQLHQFRGRVGRGEHQSYCFLFTDSFNPTTRERLQALVNSSDGFSLAEKDLQFRGAGEIYGKRQSGMPNFKIASLTDVELIQSAREQAEKLLSKDPEISKNPLLKKKLEEWQRSIHLE